MLVEAREQLFSFYRSLEEQLQFHKGKSPPTVIFLHMSYNMSQMLIHRPYLNEPPQSSAHRLSIRSMATAASGMVRLIRAYEKMQSLDKVPPFVVHSIHTAAITLLLTATSTSPAVRSQSISRFRVCLLALEAMRMRWSRAKQAVLSLQQLAQRWRIAIALPMRSNNPPDRRGSEVARSGNDVSKTNDRTWHQREPVQTTTEFGQETLLMPSYSTNTVPGSVNGLNLSGQSSTWVSLDNTDFVNDFSDWSNLDVAGIFGDQFIENDPQSVFGDFFWTLHLASKTRIVI